MTNSSSLRFERHRQMPASIRQRNGLALQHLGLAGLVASRLHRRGLDDLDDLMQEARIGLLRGAERFNRQRGAQHLPHQLRQGPGAALPPGSSCHGAHPLATTISMSQG